MFKYTCTYFFFLLRERYDLVFRIQLIRFQRPYVNSVSQIILISWDECTDNSRLEYRNMLF